MFSMSHKELKILNIGISRQIGFKFKLINLPVVSLSGIINTVKIYCLEFHSQQVAQSYSNLGVLTSETMNLIITVLSGYHDNNFPNSGRII